MTFKYKSPRWDCHEWVSVWWILHFSKKYVHVEKGRLVLIGMLEAVSHKLWVYTVPKCQGRSVSLLHTAWDIQSMPRDAGGSLTKLKWDYYIINQIKHCFLCSNIGKASKSKTWLRSSRCVLHLYVYVYMCVCIHIHVCGYTWVQWACLYLCMWKPEADVGHLSYLLPS